MKAFTTVKGSLLSSNLPTHKKMREHEIANADLAINLSAA
jgi:hypothetical protein